MKWVPSKFTDLLLYVFHHLPINMTMKWLLNGCSFWAKMKGFGFWAQLGDPQDIEQIAKALPRSSHLDMKGARGNRQFED